MSWDFEKHYINGEWTPSEDDAWIEVENPATLERFARIPDGTPAPLRPQRPRSKAGARRPSQNASA